MVLNNLYLTFGYLNYLQLRYIVNQCVVRGVRKT